MLFIGLTGGIASGKSTVSAMLKNLSIALVDADQVAREVVLPDSPWLAPIADHFGSRVLQADGMLNRAILGEIIFANKEARLWLNQLLHPAIEETILSQADLLVKQGATLIFFDIPLLFETGWQVKMHENWLVYLDEEKQLERLMKRDCISLVQAKQRIQSQMSLSEKIKLADVVIDNSGDQYNTSTQVRTELERLKLAVKPVNEGYQ